MNKINVSIKGMHCRSCEILIEEKLLEVAGVKKIDANHKKGLVEISYNSHCPKMDDIENAIQSAGYSIGKKEKTPFLNRSAKDFKDLLVAILVLIVVYLLFKKLGIFNVSLVPQSSSFSLPVVLLVGLTAGFSSCMALIGGLVLGISARHREKHPEATPMQNFRPHIFFNLGRITFFMIFGGLLGVFGSFFQFSSLTLGILTALVGLVMLFLGIKLTGISPWLEDFGFTLPKSISRLLGSNKHQKEYSHKNSFVAGGLTFFLPCGFTQTMQIYAVSTGSFFMGSLVMGLFALGTVPGLVGIGGIAASVKGLFARRFFKFAGVTVIVLSIINLSNGYNLIALGKGLNTFDTKGQGQGSQLTTKDSKQVQVIKMVSDSYGYSPKKLTVKKGIPVRWEIEVKDPYSCAVSFLVPKLGLKTVMKKGMNVVTFTPTEVEKIPFSCTMGMFNGVIEVVE